MEIDISNKIRTLCKNRRISLKEMSEGIGITPTGLQAILTNNTTSIERLRLISKFLDIPVGYFFDEVPLPGQVTQNANGSSSTNNYVQNNNTESKCLLDLDKANEKIKNLEILLNAKEEMLKMKSTIIEMLEEKIQEK